MKTTTKRLLPILVFGSYFYLLTNDGSSNSLHSFYKSNDGSFKAKKPSALHHRRLCTRSEIRNGVWKPRQYDRLPYLAKQADKKQCYNASHLNQPWNTYEWQPHDCEFTQWNETQFCSLAINMTIAFLGDSSTLEQFSSLVNILGVQDFDEESTYEQGGPERFQFSICNNKTRLVFERDNWMRRVDNLAQYAEPDILILNRGAWYSPDAGLLKRVGQQVGSILSWRERCLAANREGRSNRRCHLLWRTTVPGHPWCSNFTEPASDIEQAEAWIANQSLYLFPEQKNYHWWDFKKQNDLVLDLLNNSLGHLDEGSFYNVIDAYEINVLRPDDHVGKGGDCFHNCQPGKTLVYNQILLHYMRQQREEEEAAAG